MIVAFKHMVLNDSRNPDFNQAHTKSSHKHYGHYGSKWVTPKIHLVATLNITKIWPCFLVTPNFESPNFANMIEWTPSTQHCTRPWRWNDKKVSWEKWGTQVKRLKTAAQELWQDLISIIWWSRCKKAVPKKISKDCDFFLGLYTQIYLFLFFCFSFFIRN